MEKWTKSILGMFVLILMHFSWGTQIWARIKVIVTFTKTFW